MGKGNRRQERKIKRLLRRFKWHRALCRFYGRQEYRHIRVMEDVAHDLESMREEEQTEE